MAVAPVMAGLAVTPVIADGSQLVPFHFKTMLVAGTTLAVDIHLAPSHTSNWPLVVGPGLERISELPFKIEMVFPDIVMVCESEEPTPPLIGPQMMPSQ